MKTSRLKHFLCVAVVSFVFLAPRAILLCRAQEEPVPDDETGEQVQEGQAQEGQAQGENDSPVGDQQEGDSPVAVAGPRVSVHTPTAIERNEKASLEKFGLAENGRALAPIVIAAKASPETKAAAQELAGFLQRITGATFAIETPDGKAATVEPTKYKSLVQRQEAAKTDAAARLAAPAEPLPATGIVLGTADEFSVPELAAPLAIREGFNGREAFAIRPGANRLLLIAATERGISHVVYRLLDEIGCRWFFPNPHWEVIPSQPNLSFGSDITDRPTIASRTIAFMDGSFSDATINGVRKSERGDLRNWSRHNLLGYSLQTSAGHAWQNVVKENNAVLVDHPEYFAEVNGQRQQLFITDRDGNKVLGKDGKPVINALFVKLELGNPAVRKMFVDYALNRFRERPDLDMVSLDPTDGGGQSQSAESKKLGTFSDAVFGMANEVARAVQQEFPGKMIGMLAYNYHIEPPAFDLEPNVYVELTAGFNMSKYSYAQLFEMWPKKARNLGFYEYFSVFDWDHSLLPGGRAANVAWVAGRVPFYAGMNATSLFAQSTDAWGAHGRGYYLASKLMWNPQADANAILTDFYAKAYGPAAKIMQRFHERIDPGSGNFLTDNLLGLAFRDVDEATHVAKDRPDVLARLNDIKIFLRYEQLSWMMARETDKTKKRELFVTMMRHLAGTRFSYMAHFAGATYRLGKLHAAEFNDITVINKSSRSHPKFAKIAGDRNAPDVWDGATEPTPEQIEADFQEGLKLFPAVETPEKKFDLSDLVPVQFPPSVDPAPPRKRPAVSVPVPGAPAAGATGEAPAATRSDATQGATRYAFCSFTGEPLELDVLAGFYRQYSGRGDAVWSVSKADGKGGETRVLEGKLPLDNAPHHLSLKVPGKGAYFFAVDPHGSGVRITYTVDKPFSRVWARGGNAMFNAPVFYVPKGTKEIQYFWNGYAHDIYGPDGKTAGRVSEAHTIATIPVPAGMDGQIWRMKTQLRGAWFLNIPNIVAATPEALLIPREIALKDGLPIRTK